MSTVKMNNIRFYASILLLVLFAENVFSQNASEMTKADSSEIFNKIRLRLNGRIILFHNDRITENEMHSIVMSDNNYLINEKVKKAKRNTNGQHFCFVVGMSGLAVSAISLGVNYFVASFNPYGNSSFDKERWNEKLAAFSVGALGVSCGFFIGYDSFKDVKRKCNKEIVEIYNQKF